MCEMFEYSVLKHQQHRSQLQKTYKLKQPWEKQEASPLFSLETNTKQHRFNKAKTWY